MVEQSDRFRILLNVWRAGGRGLSIALLALLAPMATHAQAVSCDGARIDYVQTGDDTLDPATCGGNVCQTPELVGPVYTFDSACNPYLGSCDGTAELEAHFPGNHVNPFYSFYSFATVQLYTTGGSYVGSCGNPGATITEDFGTVTVHGAVDCSNPGAGLYEVRAIACKDLSCQEMTTVQLDFAVAAGCIVPPTESCGAGDASCVDCVPGGLGVGGSPPGFGGAGDEDTGPGARLRYTAGGVGHPNLPGSSDWTVTLGRYWSHDYARRIIPAPDESHVYLLTRYATFRQWSDPDPTNGVYQQVVPSNEYRSLTWTGTGWDLTELDGTVHAFGAGGLWLSSTDRNGNATTAVYSGGVLTEVHFPDGRREDFTYHAAGDPAEGKLETITEVGVDGSTSLTWTYDWGDSGGDDLQRIDRPDGTALVFTYGDPSHPGFLTRVELEGEDGTSMRTLRAWELDTEGNAVASWIGDASKTGPDAVDLWELAFDDPADPTVTTVTDPLGQESTYQLGRDTVSDNVKVLSIEGDCPTCGLGPNTTFTYGDANHPLLPTATTDGRGIVTATSYDANGQRTSRTEAIDESEQRTTTWSYDPDYPGLVTSVEQPSVAGGAAVRTTEWLRDASGNPTTRRITGVERGSAFTHDTVSTFNAAGQPLTTDPPGHGTDDETSWSYDPARGDLLATERTDPLIGATTFGYDAFNRRTSVTGPNGVETTTAYDAFDRVTAVHRVGSDPGGLTDTGDLVTTHEYGVFGDLERTTLPRGNVIEYGYDPAGRLISIERKPDAETSGERTLYTLDAAGNRTREELQRWDVEAGAWVTASSTHFEYASRCQVTKTIQSSATAGPVVTEYAYDCNGNLEQVWDANHPRYDGDTGSELPETALYQYDALNRLTSVMQPWGGTGGGHVVTEYAYDIQDHLVQVTDAEGNVTTYTYSDRDLLTHELSEAFVDPSATCNPAPACDAGCGCTSHTYDDHGELVETLDARGVTTTRTVDALDRVTFVDYPGTALDVSYDYDTQPTGCGGTSFPVGRLGSITRGGESVDLCYDRFGRTTRDGELTSTYDANGNRSTIGYPGSVLASYSYDFADRPTGLTVEVGTDPAKTVASGGAYLPSGPLTALDLGNGVSELRVHDGRYAPERFGVTGLDPTGGGSSGQGDRTWFYTTDPVGNVLRIVERTVCPTPPLVLENQTLTNITQTYTHCSSIEAGNGFEIGAGSDVTFEAADGTALLSGFAVTGTDARFEVRSGPVAGTTETVRSYGYQDVQYFLTSAAGTWPEKLAWTYDGIGNRLTETRDDGVTPDTDTYVYASNGATGNTPILDQVSLAVGSTRDYTWGAAGHLEEVAAGANVLDFAADDAGRMLSVDRTAAGEAAGFLYDGRSYLRRAEQTAGGTGSVEPVYDSAGRIHAIRRKESSTADEDLVLFLYLAGRPVAQLALDAAGTATWTYLTTDHLGTPLLATDDTAAIVWQGGFRPFGDDWQAGTTAGALDNGIYLRLPGQWEDGSWTDASSGAGVYYNVHRWYMPGVGRYSSTDPVRLGRALESYLYGGARPTMLFDPLGLQTTSGPAPTGNPTNDKCCGAAHSQNLFSKVGASGIVVCCDGKKVACALVYSHPRLTKSGALAQKLWTDCTFKHEGVHVQDLPPCPPCSPGPTPVVDLAQFPTPGQRAASECRGLRVDINCLQKAKAGCAGDPVCINAIDAKKGAARQDQQRFGCPP